VADRQEVDIPVRVTASNGVVWTRKADGTSTGPELLQALENMVAFYKPWHQWSWWQEGREKQERARWRRVLEQWDNGADLGSGQDTEEDTDAAVQAYLDELDKRHEEKQQRRVELVATSYDKDRATARLRLLRAEADAAFFAHVLEAPASDAQREAAERRMANSQEAADDLRQQVGDAEQVIDHRGYLPAERRELNLSSHMRNWRHPCLREWEKKDRRRFTALLKMPAPDPSAMCSECQAPTEWHGYDLSLALFRQQPPAGSQAETLARLLPGWWERCVASTGYNIEHKWGGSHALPDFDGDQWQAMLPPLLRTLFAPDPPKPKRKPQPKPQPLAVIAPGPISEVMTQLTEAQAKYPTAQVRRGKSGNWELWPT
jgi:Mn-dependent DtxR family transcriptional regulator